MKASANSRIYRQIKIWCNYFNDENDIIMWQRIHQFCSYINKDQAQFIVTELNKL